MVAATSGPRRTELGDRRRRMAEHIVPELVRDGPASIVGIVQPVREQDSRTMRAYDQLRACAVELRLDQLDAKLMRQRVDLQVVRRLHTEFVEEPTSLAPSNC
jgi:hypothetical protein